MAEIAIAAAISAAVSAAAYTVNYALTPKAKPIHQGRLSGDIVIQDSRYGHMIPILLGGNPVDQTGGGGSIVAFVAAAIADVGTCSKPAGTIENDVMLAGVWHDDTLTPPAGWAQIATDSADAGDFFYSVFRKVAGAAEPASYTWVSSGPKYVSISTYRNADPANPVHIISAAAKIEGNSSASLVLPSITTTVDGCRIVILCTQDSTSVTATAPPGYTERLDQFGEQTFEKSQTTAGATGTATVTQSAAESAIGFHLALKPNPAAPAADPGGGMRVAGNVIYMSDVRKVETTTPAEGGKGFGNKNPDTITTNYYCDLAIMFSEGEMSLAKLYAGADLIIDLERASSTGVIDPSVPIDSNQNNILLHSPSDSTIASRPSLRFGSVVSPDGDGTITATLAAGNGADFRFYSGSETQQPDPLLEAHFGVGDTPAYLGRCYIVLENFEVGKYGHIPNFTAILNNVNLKTAAQCIDHLCQRVGLEASDFDVSNVTGYNVRGIPIINREGPRNTVDLIGKLFNFDVVETDGEIICVLRGGAPSFAVAEDDLGALEVEGVEDAQDTDVPELVVQERQLDQTTLPKRVDLKFYDPARQGETNTAGVTRIESLANGFVTEEVNAVLTFTEGRRLAQQILDTAWIESAGAIRFRVPHTFASQIKPAAVGTVTRNGMTHLVRVKEVNGFVPGVIEAVGIITKATTYSQTTIVPSSDAGSPLTAPTTPAIPATTVATFIDRLLRDRELQAGKPGFYVAACSFGNGSWPSANVYVDRGSGFIHLVNLPEQATMGVVDATPATIAGGSTVDVELYGEQTLPTFTAGEVTGGAGYILIGKLVLQYQNAVQLSTSPNKWRLTVLSNIGAKCTTAENGSHAAGERFVVLNNALRFVALEADEINVVRDYKVPTAGADLNDTGVISFTVTAPNTAITTPADYSMTAGNRSISHSWTPFANECVMTAGLVYEIRDDAAGSPGALLYAGNAQPWVETALEPGEYTRHFRATSNFSEGAYVTDTVTVLTIPGPSAHILLDDFIIHFYQGALARDPTPTELADEIALLVAAEGSGVDYYTAAVDLGDRLFHDAEHTALALTDEEFVTALYRGYMARVPDAAGLEHWLDELAATSRDHLLEAFAVSPEFRLRVFNVYGWHPEDVSGGTPEVRLIQFEFDGRGNVIDPLTQPNAVLPFFPVTGTIIETYIKDVNDIAGTCEIDLRLAARGSAPPGSGESICGGSGNRPKTTAQSEATKSTFTGWTSTTITANDEVRAVIISNANHQHLTLIVKVQP